MGSALGGAAQLCAADDPAERRVPVRVTSHHGCRPGGSGTPARAVNVHAVGVVTLNMTGETVLAVPPLAAPEAGRRLTVAALARFPAVDLFAERAAQVIPGFTLTEACCALEIEECLVMVLLVVGAHELEAGANEGSLRSDVPMSCRRAPRSVRGQQLRTAARRSPRLA